MIEVEEAIQILKAQVQAKSETMKVNLLACGGHILAEDIYAPINVPDFPKAAMDGYAVKSADSTGALKEHPICMKVIGELFAGDYKEFNPKPFEAVRIMTGACIPEGFDCVIKQEDTDYGEALVLIYKEMKPYENYCQVGEDIIKSNLVMEKYTRLTSIHIGTLASLGFSMVPVIKPVTVGIISTGSELLAPGDKLTKGKIYDSISYTLASRMIQRGLNVIFMEHCEDDINKLAYLMEQRIPSIDLLITTGGISVGKKDYLMEVMQKLKARLLFQRVQMQPGTPVMAHEWKGKIILSVSGNPFAAFVNFEIFFWPLVSKLINYQGYEGNYIYNLQKEGILLNDGIKTGKLRRFYRAIYDEGKVYLPDKNHKSSVFSNLKNCNCFIDVPKETVVNKGDKVKVLYFNNF